METHCGRARKPDRAWSLTEDGKISINDDDDDDDDDNNDNDNDEK